MTQTQVADRPRAGSLLGSRPGAALALLGFAQFIIAIDLYIVVVASPEIGAELGFSAQTLQAVISAYALTFGGFLLLGGRASDLLGKRRIFATGLGLYGVSSLAGGLASSAEVLLAARAVQGIGGALLFPATLALINTTFAEGRERNRALAVWASAGAAGLVVGVLLGGVLTAAFGWEAVFFVNVPLALGALAAAFLLLASDGPRDAGRSFDVPGAVTATLGITLAIYALVQGPERGWGSPVIITAAVAGVVLLAAFVAIEARSRDPLMPLRLLRNRNLSAAMGIALLFMATFGVLLFFITQYLQHVHGYSALETGMAFLPATVVIAIGASAGGQLTTRFGARDTLVCSLGVGTFGAALLAFSMSADASYIALLPGLLLVSLANGLVYPTMFIAAATGVADEEQGIASGMMSTGAQVGAALGLALFVLVANAGTGGLGGEALRVATADGLRTTVYAMTGAIAATGLVALTLRRRAAVG